MADEEFGESAVRNEAKALIRALINHILDRQVLHSRQLLRDLQAFDEPARLGSCSLLKNRAVEMTVLSVSLNKVALLRNQRDLGDPRRREKRHALSRCGRAWLDAAPATGPAARAAARLRRAGGADSQPADRSAGARAEHRRQPFPDFLEAGQRRHAASMHAGARRTGCEDLRTRAGTSSVMARG